MRRAVKVAVNSPHDVIATRTTSIAISALARQLNDRSVYEHVH